MTGAFLVQPFRFGDARGSIAITSDADRHLRDKILAILFTAPGERVNRPRFGVGLDRTVFDGLGELTLATVEFRIVEGLARDLGDEARIDAVTVELGHEQGELVIAITYRRPSDQRARTMEVIW